MLHNGKNPPLATAGSGAVGSAAKQIRSPHNTVIAPQQVIVVSPTDRRDRFAARLDGRVLVRSSRTPFCDAARVLLAEGFDHSITIVMRHRGSDVDALRARLGVAARLTVREEDGRAPRFTRWKPLHLGDGSARAAADRAASVSCPRRRSRGL